MEVQCGEAVFKLGAQSVWMYWGESLGAHLSVRKLKKSNAFCQIDTEIMSWSSCGNKCVQIYDMRRLLFGSYGYKKMHWK